MHLEVQVIPVSDVDRSKQFYQRLGWRLDDDAAPLDGLRNPSRSKVTLVAWSRRRRRPEARAAVRAPGPSGSAPVSLPAEIRGWILSRAGCCETMGTQRAW